MDCEKYLEWISLYIDGELEDGDSIILEQHINKCDSCRQEIDILKEIINNIKELEIIDPPVDFHNTLMEKIKLEKKVTKQKTIPIPINKNKWYSRIKIASAVAAVFIFSVILINPLKTNAPQEAVPEMAGDTKESRVMIKGTDTSFRAMPSEESQMTAYDVAENTLAPVFETWVIETKDYEKYKEEITRVSNDMGLEVMVAEELDLKEVDSQNITMEIELQYKVKNELETQIRKIDEEVHIEVLNEYGSQQEQKDDETVTLLIIIN